MVLVYRSNGATVEFLLYHDNEHPITSEFLAFRCRVNPACTVQISKCNLNRNKFWIRRTDKSFPLKKMLPFARSEFDVFPCAMCTFFSLSQIIILHFARKCPANTAKLVLSNRWSLWKMRTWALSQWALNKDVNSLQCAHSLNALSVCNKSLQMWNVQCALESR